MKLDSIAAMRTLLSGMEDDLGLNDLTSAQRDVFYAVTLLNRADGPASAKDIQAHDLLAQMSRATLFRCLKSLTQLGYLLHEQEQDHSAGYIARLP